MSLQLEESPLSDSKMDISDTTTSLDSTGVSPVAEAEEELKAPATTPTPAPCHNHIDQIAKRVVSDNMQNENDLVETASAAQLDNRIAARPEMLPLDAAAAAQRHGIARTLANSHPLMSPTGVSTDSDSEQSLQQHQHNHHQQQQQNQHSQVRKCHNFPDVVPRNEHIQTASVPVAVSLAISAPSDTVEARNTLNNMHVHGPRTASNVPRHNKLTLLRTHSPDLLSSESETEVSQYHATVEANFQSVALVSNGAAQRGGTRQTKKCGSAVAGCEDISSLDSISNHSFDDDEDLEHNLASLSPSSSLIDGLDDDDDDDDDDDCEGPELMPDGDDYDFPNATTPTPNARAGAAQSTAVAVPANGADDTLPQYSAAEERRDSRNWQKITLPDGRTREIDMRVIEPYKRVLSHGGYLKSGGHNAIVIFCACHLPDRSRADYSYVMDNLFLYVVKTLEQLVTEDYVLIYLHGGTNRRNVPPFPWLKKCYQLLDRRLRKSLKNMYLVHPTFWIKSIVWMARPFVSTKFWRKLIYVKSLKELNTHVTVERAAIPEKVKQYDAKHN